MKFNLSTQVASLVLTIGAFTAAPSANAGFTDWMQKQWDAANQLASTTYQENWDKIPGKITVCSATELKGWMNELVVPKFKEKAPRIDVKIEAHGSGKLIDAMNAGNTMGCDILIPGSDVSGLRWKSFADHKRQYVAYTPTVWVGDKTKLDAARTHLGKQPGAPLNCSDLSAVSTERRYSKIKQGGKGKLDLEMTTSNSGQTMYVSCVYSILDAIDPADVEDQLNEKPELEDKVRAFFKSVKFQLPSTTTLTLKGEGQFLHPNGVSYKHLAIATYESLLPELAKSFESQGKEMEVIYPPISILNNFPVMRVTNTGKNGKATEAFVAYLTGKEAQAGIVNYGFRPANPTVKYGKEPATKFFNKDIEVGDAPSTQQMLRDLWDIVSDEEKSKAVKFLTLNSLIL